MVAVRERIPPGPESIYLPSDRLSTHPQLTPPPLLPSCVSLLSQDPMLPEFMSHLHVSETSLIWGRAERSS